LSSTNLPKATGGQNSNEDKRRTEKGNQRCVQKGGFVVGGGWVSEGSALKRGKGKKYGSGAPCSKEDVNAIKKDVQHSSDVWAGASSKRRTKRKLKNHHGHAVNGRPQYKN